jgi:hypothetical protein
MKRAWRMVVTVGASSILAAAAWALPPKIAALASMTQQQDAMQLQSVSGKIQSVQTNSFTLQTAETAPPQGQRLVGAQSEPATMTFLVDKNTTIDGKLKVGSNADVTYRQDNGNNVAVSVTVTP